MKSARFFLLGIVWAVLSTPPVHAHKPSDSYLTIIGGQSRLSAQWDIALKDLEMLVGLDADQNGQITWGELKARQQAIAAHALSRLTIEADGVPCELKLARLMVTRHSDGSYAVLLLESVCPGDARVLDVHYQLLFDADPTHRGLVLYRNGSVASTHVLSPSEPTLELRTGETHWHHALVDYIRVGIWHIWIGYDHILFLISLLLPAVLVRRDRRWEPVETFRPAWVAVLKIVTVFTLAHSITLWLAVMQYVTLPGRMVEATIAFSIVITAIHNLYPILPVSGWAIAFVFGLVHGFGFANVLLDLGLSNVTLAVALLGFNVGVELGQLAIVAVFLPLALLMRRTGFYRRAVLSGGSVLIGGIAVLWMIERVGNTVILGF
jgi:hypothetical protein